MSKMLNKNFNSRKILEDILFTNQERIAKEISNKYNDFSILENYQDILDFDYLFDKRIYGFVIKHSRINDRKDFKAIKKLGESLDLSFLNTDFINYFGIKTFPIPVETVVYDMGNEYRFVIPNIDAASDKIVSNILSNHRAVNGK